MGRHLDNPDINQFGYNNNTTQIQRKVSHTSDNTLGRYNKKGHGKKLLMTKYQNGTKQSQTTYLYFQYY